jgi:uncharacterized membrane protein
MENLLNNINALVIFATSGLAFFVWSYLMFKDNYYRSHKKSSRGMRIRAIRESDKVFFCVLFFNTIILVVALIELATEWYYKSFQIHPFTVMAILFLSSSLISFLSTGYRYDIKRQRHRRIKGLYGPKQ